MEFHDWTLKEILALIINAHNVERATTPVLFAYDLDRQVSGASFFAFTDWVLPRETSLLKA